MTASSERGASSVVALPQAEGAAAQTGAAMTVAGGRSAFVPVLLSSLALLAWLIGQAVAMGADRQNLQAAHLSQQQTVDNAGKLRVSLDGLAADTQRLAEAGNASAGLLVAELRKRGITINAKAGEAAAAPAATPPR